MGKYTVSQIDEDTGENDNERTTDIVDITLVTAIITLPSMGDNLLNDVKHIIYSKMNE